MKLRWKYFIGLLVTSLVPLVVVTLFEVDIRLHGWESRAAGEIGGSASSSVWQALYLHLVFAISTVLLWPCGEGW